MTYDAVIISGGSLDDEAALHFIQKNSSARLAAADAGVRFFLRHGIVPDLAVGDFDSITEEETQRLSELETEGSRVIRLIPQKDMTDTCEALRLVAEAGAKRIALLGCMGGRLDHTLANLCLLVSAEKLGAEAFILDPQNRISLAKPGMILHKSEMFGKYVSFFAFGSPVEGLTLSEFAYPLQDHTLRAEDGTLTVSNELAADEAGVTFRSGSLIMVESADRAGTST